jgi:tetratricopeptide (TPR) repeat protein
MRLRLLLPALALVAAGCDDALTTEPSDSVPIEREIVDAASARAALVGAYDALQSLSYVGLDLALLGDLPSDNARHTGTFQYLGAIDRHLTQADNSEVTDMWEAIYEALARTNLIIAKVPAITGLDDAEKNEILGEAYFLRALHLHNLVKFWGDVPMPLDPITSAAEAANVTRTPAPQVYDQILKDLDQAAQLITNTEQTRQASSGAVDALRARVLLYKGDYAGALAAANAVEARGYELAPTFTDLFTANGTDTPEDIFRVSFTPTEYNEIGYYYLGAGRREVQPTADLNAAFSAGDVRKAATVAARGSSNLQGVKYPTTIGAEHVHVIRFAEIILIKAEALARLGQLPEAVDEYNRIRVRAGLAPHVLGTDVTTQDDVLAAIDRERRLELALEGDRWPDLVRTGRAASVEKLTNDTMHTLLYPIPAREIVTAPGLTQNPGY